PAQPTRGTAAVSTASPPDSAQANGTGQAASGTDQSAAGTSQPPDTSSDQAPSSDATSTTAASQSTADANADAPTSTPAERRASTLIGMTVIATDGVSLGSVKDIIFDRQGRATHLVIAYGKELQANPGSPPNDGEAAPAPDGKLTAMPWDAAMASVKDGHLVLDGAQLQGAPSFTTDAWPNLDDPTWSNTADAYWRTAVQAAIEAHPGAPVDPTSRQRARPIRDGE
ncbi:MAG: PRC-barrel domain-containing protein, partial [Steroidobacteraceae bacterium]